MKRSKKIWLIIATIFVLAGLGVFAVTMTAVGWDISRLSTVKYAAKTLEIGESFDDLSVRVSADDIVLAPSDDSRCRVVCYEDEAYPLTVGVEGRTLTVHSVNPKNWIDFAARFSFETPKVTVYLPKKAYASLNIDVDFGNVDIAEALSFHDMRIHTAAGNVKCRASCENELEIKTSAGNLELTGVEAERASLATSTGNIRLNAVICRGQLTADTSTGNIHLNGCDAERLSLKTSTGNVKGTLLSDKVFVTDTATGTVRVPQTATGGKCEIKTGLGNIDIAIADK